METMIQLVVFSLQLVALIRLCIVGKQLLAKLESIERNLDGVDSNMHTLLGANNNLLLDSHSELKERD